MLETAFFSVSSACCCPGPQTHSVSSCVNSLSGFVMSDRWDRNLLRYCASQTDAALQQHPQEAAFP